MNYISKKIENWKRKNAGKSFKMPYTEAKIFEEFSYNFKQELDKYAYTFLKRVTIMWLETRKKAFIVTGPDKQSTRIGPLPGQNPFVTQTQSPSTTNFYSIPSLCVLIAEVMYC